MRTSPRDARVLTRIAERTARFHVQNIIEKLGVAGLRRAAERATGFGLAGQSV